MGNLMGRLSILHNNQKTGFDYPPLLSFDIARDATCNGLRGLSPILQGEKGIGDVLT